MNPHSLVNSGCWEIRLLGLNEEPQGPLWFGQMADFWQLLWTWRQHWPDLPQASYSVEMRLSGKQARVVLPYAEFAGRFYSSSLRAAFDLERLTCHWQPIVSCNHEHQIFGYELLARWQSAGLVLNGWEVFETAPNPANRWEAERLALETAVAHASRGPVENRCFVNLNPELFFHEVVTELNIQAWLNAGLQPQQVVWEILESSYPYPLDALVELVDCLRGYGFQIAIDDWGRQSHGLELVKHLQPNFLKIEGELVQGCGVPGAGQRQILGLLAYSQQVGIPLILEGIESPVDWAWLQSSSSWPECFGQGFLLGRPAPRATWSDASGLTRPDRGTPRRNSSTPTAYASSNSVSASTPQPPAAHFSNLLGKLTRPCSPYEST